MVGLFPFFVMSLALISTAQSPSFYPTRIEDKGAIYLDAPEFSAKGNGVVDDSDALQKAIDAVPGAGIVFVPSGRYRLSKTVVVWPGVRLIGVGPIRPVFVLGANTPGYQKNEKFMLFFAGSRPRPDRPFDYQQTAPDGRNGLDFELNNEANPGTFYSAVSNINIEIQNGNPAAVGIRAKYAQHCFLSHMDFQLNDALAGVHDIGNFAEDLTFNGGQYGLITRTPSPGWQFTMMDARFDGQEVAAISTRVTGLTLVRPHFSNVPTAVAITPGLTEQLWMQDAKLENISGPAITISREKSLRLQLNAENLECKDVPVFARFESGRELKGKGRTYTVGSFSHGLHFGSISDFGQVKTVYEAKPGQPSEVAQDAPRTVPSTKEWIDVTKLGAIGDGKTDNTTVLREAIAKHPTLYFPTGFYLVSDTILLKPNTTLIGLNPMTTRIMIADGTPAFAGVPEPPADPNPWYRPGPPFAGAPHALIETQKGSHNLITGIGIDTGGKNPAAVGVLWRSSEHSVIDDVKFLGGHGTGGPAIYDAHKTGDPNPERRWDSQYPSLWVTEGGGGTFKDLWTASPYAQAGMMVSETSTKGQIYQVSSEHHVRNEVILRNASNWSLVALQTEEERGEGPSALPLELTQCSNIKIANMNMYRVVSMVEPFNTAVSVVDSPEIKFRGFHCYSNSKVSFDNAISESASGAQLRQREFAYFHITNTSKPVAPNSKVKKLAGGFHNISGGAVAPNGDFYFVDAKRKSIYCWSVSKQQVRLVQDAPLSPVNLVFDDSGNLLVISSDGRGTVYSFNPEHPGLIELLSPIPATFQNGTPILPATYWEFDWNLMNGHQVERPFHIVSKDHSVFIPVGQDFIDGALSWGAKLQDVIRTFGLSRAFSKSVAYITSEAQMQTYRCVVDQQGNLSHPELFAEQGGECLAVSPQGDVYLAAGQVFVYDSKGKLKQTIRVPERPIQVVLGGTDGNTLFICARTSLYSYRIK